ncbi:hypothetical protein [Streptomyces bottropensis]|uniref:hypothetical protein n=1 Tax=Streptomyces bottropensis TaxID=42235 RepID=UPI003677600B
MTSNKTDVHDLTDEELLPLMVAAERRNRQRRRGLKILLYPEPPCVLCGAIPNEQSVDQPLPESMLQRLVVNEPCGHRMRYSLLATERLAPQVQVLVDAEENRPAGTSALLKTRPGDQPLPSGGRECVQDALIADIRARRDLGVQRYGSQLMTHNGRNAVQDALEEAVDLAVYLKQVAMETRDREQELAVLRAEVAAARQYAEDMREFASPHNVSVHYAEQLTGVMDRARAAHAKTDKQIENEEGH